MSDTKCREGENVHFLKMMKSELVIFVLTYLLFLSVFYIFELSKEAMPFLVRLDYLYLQSI